MRLYNEKTNTRLYYRIIAKGLQITGNIGNFWNVSLQS